MTATAPVDEHAYDVCVYAATASGILAAVAVKREGRSVVIVEPSRWLGGILGSGIKPMQDCPNHEATGGLTRKLLKSLGQPDDPAPWLPLNRMRPSGIREDFFELLAAYNIPVIYNHRVARVEKMGSRITEAWFELAPFDESGLPPAEAEQSEALRVRAQVFIDASYEGDLMARSGVSYHIGRESAEAFNEELGGVREPVLLTPIDPFIEPGNPQSGLLKWVEDDHGKPVGAADPYTQAYNFRYYVTSNPEYRVEITPPEGYDPQDFELVGRYVEYLKEAHPDEEALHLHLRRIFPGWLNAGEYNYHRNSLITMAPVGVSHLYADGDYETKARIWKMHRDYLRGLHAFLSSDPRVPQAFREETAALGLDGRHHVETGGWPHQLYVRVSRRLMGRYVLTANDVYNRTQVEDPVCLTQYGIDVYPVRRFWTERDGRYFVAIEGWMFVGGAAGPTQIPYPIPYRSITPRLEECENLIVPVCFSATHLAYASARMEPAFMMCGEAAGIAACQAIDAGLAVQKIDQKAFQQALYDAGMVLEWKTTD